MPAMLAPTPTSATAPTISGAAAPAVAMVKPIAATSTNRLMPSPMPDTIVLVLAAVTCAWSDAISRVSASRLICGFRLVLVRLLRGGVEGFAEAAHWRRIRPDLPSRADGALRPVEFGKHRAENLRERQFLVVGRDRAHVVDDLRASDIAASNRLPYIDDRLRHLGRTSSG